MKVKLPALLVLLVCAIAPAARAGGFETFTWNDATRDVYIDNEVDRSAQVLMLDAPRRVAVISPKLDRALVLDVTERTVSTLPKDAFRVSADHASATSDSSAQAEAAGRFAQVDGSTYLFALNGRAILIKPHPGLTGEVSEARLLETVPVWRSLMGAYKPAPEAVSALRAADAEATLTVVLGSWCPDSKNYVPRLLKALHAAGNDRLRVNIIGIDSQFHDPMATIQQRGITNVPTLIVERGGREIGRVVETPASDSMEQDLVAILNGKQPPHPGRWERGPKLAQGVYVYKDASGKERGMERWELYSTAEGGNLVHSRITSGDTITEIWHRVDAARKPSMVEITRRRGSDVSRTRYRFGDGSLTARLRGSDSGVIEQTMSVPEKYAFTSQAVAAEGWGWSENIKGPDAKDAIRYVAPLQLDGTVGTLQAVSIEARGDEPVRVPAGEFRSRHVVRRAGHEQSDWWMHTELNIPVRGKTSGGMEFALTSIEVLQARN